MCPGASNFTSLTKWDENPRCCRTDEAKLNHAWMNVSGESRPSTHSGLFSELPTPDALLSWGSSVLRAPALLQGNGVCAGRQPPVSSQLITQLCACLTFGWTCSWGFWALSPAPSSLSLEWSTGCVCVCVCVNRRMIVYE